MRPLRHLALPLALLALALPQAAQAAREARAAGVELGLNGGYWTAGTPQFGLTLGARVRLGRHVGIGVRAGLLVNTAGQAQFGAPIDAVLRVSIKRLYLEGVGGPWFLFGDAAFLRAHAGVGVGVYLGGFTVGLEGGWLQPAGLVLVRFGFEI